MQLRCEKKSPIPIATSAIDDALLREWVALSKVEIGGVAKLADEGAYLRLYDPILLPQEVDGGEVNLDPVAVHNWLTANCGPFTEPLPYANFALWHSHGDMAVFFSSTDEKWISNFVTRGWLASVVFNRKGEVKTRVDTIAGAATEQHGLWTHFESAYVAAKASLGIEARAKADYDAMVKQKPKIVIPLSKRDYINGDESWEGWVPPVGKSWAPGFDKHPIVTGTAATSQALKLARSLAKQREKGKARIGVEFGADGAVVTRVNGLTVCTLRTQTSALPFVVVATGMPGKDVRALFGTGCGVIATKGAYAVTYGDRPVYTSGDVKAGKKEMAKGRTVKVVRV